MHKFLGRQKIINPLGKIVILRVVINETCYKTGRVSTRDFTVSIGIPTGNHGEIKSGTNDGVVCIDSTFMITMVSSPKGGMPILMQIVYL